ncbi:Retrovirus-related Pol polyprotein from transposon RE2 [Cardamine amara subsp. amara]|uniref:Retrovirus-related Pol polyprotein from transposon RE2 n=1 Tax=Cardamine amara subsp. amara TaxID=228776 RepID=A0ABD1BDK0_CARAN
MGSEVGAQEDNQTWTLEDLPPGKRAIGSMWVYKIKYNSDGTIERYKARLVALGNKQIEGEDYGETFAPVAKMRTVHLFLKVAAGHDWPVYQMDVYNVFLHGDLQEEVYMKPPPGFYSKDETKVCRLRKAIYGLKQAPRCWFEKLTTALRKYGFQQSRADYSLFTFEKGGIQINLLIYVDDMILTGNSVPALKIFKDYLATCFKMKDLGDLKYFLGIEVSRNKRGFYLSQRKYALDIVSETGLLGAKPAAFPLEQNHGLALSTSPLLVNPAVYRRLVGRLIYLAATRPDLAFCVHVLAQFMQKPRADHWEAALRIV